MLDNLDLKLLVFAAKLDYRIDNIIVLMVGTRLRRVSGTRRVLI
jgi:hypothetical protein